MGYKMPKTEENLKKEADTVIPKIKEVSKSGNGLTIPLTGYVNEGEYYSVIKKGDVIMMKKINPEFLIKCECCGKVLDWGQDMDACSIEDEGGHRGIACAKCEQDFIEGIPLGE